MKIIADKNIPFLKGVAEHFGDISYLAGGDFTKENIKDADTLITRTVARLDENNLKGSNVKLICSATIGYDHIDTDFCDRNHIKWYNAPGSNSGSVQQYIAAVLITLAKRRGFELKGKTIGVIGVGNVGKKVSSICEFLGMRVLKNDPPREKVEGKDEFTNLETIQKEADFITFHTPLSKEGEYPTYHLANNSFFEKLGKYPIIINSARGGVVDTKAIKQALTKKTISGAVIDCWEDEPNIDIEYMSMVDIATPHIAGYSADGKANATRMSLERIAEFWSLPLDPIKKIIVPQVKNSIIDYNEIAEENKIEEIILRTYNPIPDFERLVHTPSDFSKLRGDYPLRREYTAYSIKNVKNILERNKLESLGFHIVDNA